MWELARVGEWLTQQRLRKQNANQWRPGLLVSERIIWKSVRSCRDCGKTWGSWGWQTALITLYSLISLLLTVVLKPAINPLTMVRDYRCLYKHLRVIHVLFKCYTTKMFLFVWLMCWMRWNSVGYDQEVLFPPATACKHTRSDLCSKLLECI